MDFIFAGKDDFVECRSLFSDKKISDFILLLGNGIRVLNNLVKYINENLGKNIQPVYHNARAGDIKHSYADIELAKSKINYTPKIDFQKGLKLTIKSYEEESI